MLGPAGAAGEPERTGSRPVSAWLIAAALLGVAWSSACGKAPGQSPAGGRAAAFANMRVPITTAAAKKGAIGVYINALGIVTPVASVSVTSLVGGQILSVNYREGQMVHKGDVLVKIDPRLYQAQLTQAEGQLARDKALLDEAHIDLARYQAAFSRNAIAKQQLDDQEQVVLQATGTVKNDEGQVASTQINLHYCDILSPINGRVGLRLVDPGNVVLANGTAPLVLITQLQPITVVFSVAEDHLPQIQAQLSQGHEMTVDAFDRTQAKKLATGAVLTLDNVIDTTTGTVKLKAIFANQDAALFPNQFVNARLLVNTEQADTLIPMAAVQRNAQGAFVYVIKPNQTAESRPITVGTTEADIASVTGVAAGEVIAVNGFDKLQDGAKVAVSNGAKAASTAPGGRPGGANRRKRSST
jgi:membrane fusion protein, multidrug efflux system